MKFESFFKNSFLKQNYTVNDVLSNYDSDNIDKKDGKFSKKEVSIFIDNSIIDFGTFFIGKKRLTNLMFKLMNTNQDEYITIDEINAYLKKEFKGITVDDLRQKDIKEACAILDAAG